MKRFVITILIFLGFLLSASTGYAQSGLENSDLTNVKIDSYSDEQLKAFYQKAVESGLTDVQVYKMLTDRGLPNLELTKLKNRMETMNFKKSSLPNSDQEEPQKNTHPRDTTNKELKMQNNESDLSIFGSELFTKNSLVFEPNLRIPTPAGYILGPDDEIVVMIYGYSEKNYNLQVNESGNIYIPNVGPIYVSGLSIDQAQEKIKLKLSSTIYRNLKSGQTKIQITLGKIRSIRVTVIGQAKKPGTYTISSLTTLYNLLYLCGGPTALGSYRQIQLIRGNEIKRTADLYSFLLKGDQKDNLLLQEGDVIRIPYYTKRVSIKGNVKRPGKFETIGNETFNDLLQFCGNFDDTAYRGAVTVIRISETQKQIIDLPSGKYASFQPLGSDEYLVGKLQDLFENRILLSGSIVRPGPYEWTPQMTITSLIDKAGGLLNDAFSKRVSIFRYYKNRIPTVLSVNLDSAYAYNQSVFLMKDDSIAVHSIFEYRDSSSVKVIGNVRKEGDVPWRQNITLRDVLLSVGGITESGDSTNIEVSRRLKTADLTKSNHSQSDIFTINLKQVNNFDDIRLDPFDLIIVKTLPGYTNQRTVLVLGEVRSPGRYSLQKSEDKISDLFRRVGAFNASADINSITIRRSTQSNLSLPEREKLFQKILNVNQDSISTNNRLKQEIYKTYELITVNLNAAISNPESPENLILEDGDVLTVERNTNLVKISGEVYYPTIVPFKSNTNLKYYIKQAGNFTPSARKTGSVVIYPNGKAKSVKRFLFLKFYPEVTPRSEVFVPQKNKNNRTKLGATELAIIVSALGIIANVIISARKP